LARCRRINNGVICNANLRIIDEYTDRTTGKEMVVLYCPRCDTQYQPMTRARYNALEIRQKRQGRQGRTGNRYKRTLLERARLLLRDSFGGKKISELDSSDRYNFEQAISDIKKQIAGELNFTEKQMEELEKDIDKKLERQRKALMNTYKREMVKSVREKLEQDYNVKKLTELKPRDRNRFEQEISRIKRRVADQLRLTQQQKSEIERSIQETEPKTRAEQRRRRRDNFLRATGSRSESRYGGYIKKIIPFAALFIVGAVSGAFGFWFTFGFWSIGVMILLPPAREFKSKHKGAFGFNALNPFGGNYGGTHVTFGFLRSVLKISAVVCFALGFKAYGNNFGSLFMATLVVGYFILAREYDPELPSEFIESVMRFMFGFYLAIAVFGAMFNSWTLALLAIAFFAVPPTPKKGIGNLSEVLSRGLSGAAAYYELVDKLVFVILMSASLAGALGLFGGLAEATGVMGWGLEGTMKATFIYFWFVCGVGGFFSPAAQRPVTGIMMLGVGTIIYGVGPGSQFIGGNLFGDWWPTVHNGFNAVFEPISDAFGQVGKTFGNTWMMLTNPVGYATQMLNGSYTTNPTGTTGAFGLEINSFEITDMYVGQPYTVSVILKNDGAEEAEIKEIMLCSGMASFDNTATAGGVIDNEKQRVPINSDGYSINRIDGTEININSYFDFDPKEFDTSETKAVTPNGCVKILYSGNGGDADTYNTLTQQEMKQVVFSSDTGIQCPVVVDKNLRQRYLPFIASVTYEYDVHSTLNMEFMTQQEWKDNAGETTSKRVESTVTTSPAKLSIGSVNQPIITASDIQPGAPFFLGLKLQSQYPKESSINYAQVQLKFPKDFGVPTTCTEKSAGFTPKKDGENYAISWNLPMLDTDTLLLYCSFNPVSENELSGPTKTYTVTAEAHFEFSRWETENSQLEFGGAKCCAPDWSGWRALWGEVPSQFKCGEGMVCDSNEESPTYCTCIGGGTGMCGDTCVQPNEAQIDTYVDSAIARCLTQYTGPTPDFENLIDSMITVESSGLHCKDGKIHASPMGALGLMQVLQGTADDVSQYIGKSLNICEADDNIMAGSCYLGTLINHYKGETYTENDVEAMYFALAAYNCGYGNIDSIMSGLEEKTWENLLTELETRCLSSDGSKTETLNFVNNVLNGAGYDYTDPNGGITTLT